MADLSKKSVDVRVSPAEMLFELAAGCAQEGPRTIAGPAEERALFVVSGMWRDNLSAVHRN